MRVLVVEDDQILGELLQDVLAELGHDPSVVKTAEAALQVLATERPDLILLDVQLPGMSGIEFLQLRPVRDSLVPVVVVSGVATEQQAKLCLQLGALDFLSKPVSLDHLTKIIDCFEPTALTARREHRIRPTEKRRAQRADVAIPVRVREYGGPEWEATAVNVGVGGIKLRTERMAPASPLVHLEFTPPGERERFRVLSLLVRVDIDGYAFYFVNLTEQQLDRLRGIVNRLTVFAETA